MPCRRMNGKRDSRVLISPGGWSGADEQQTLTRAGLNPQGNRWVYELSPRSTEVSAKAGDFTFALSPFARPGFLSEPIQRVAGNVALPLGQNQNAWTRMDRVTQVTVVAIDRDAPRIVVDLPQDWLPSIQALEQAGVVDFARDVMLDPVHRDFFLSRLEATLNAIGNPPLAINNAVPGVTAATGQVRRPSRGTSSPAAEVLWDGASLYASPVARNTGPVRQLLAQNGLDLNPSQWRAWETSLGYRLRLIWGPPGTGKVVRCEPSRSEQCWKHSSQAVAFVFSFQVQPTKLSTMSCWTSQARRWARGRLRSLA